MLAPRFRSRQSGLRANTGCRRRAISTPSAIAYSGETAVDNTKELFVLVTNGIEHEKSSVALTIACGGITSGLKVSLFLTSSGVDIARRRGIDLAHVAPLEPLAGLVADFMGRGGRIYACPPCVKSRGYEASDLIDGVEVMGASVMHRAIQNGAATLSF
ncbi:peroxiredoxin [Rhodobacterales bacterium HKCCE2091]|nr:peroxiredoxin [Rhodobacterales bacterium HKCCE2091]